MFDLNPSIWHLVFLHYWFFQIRSLMGSQHSETNISNPKEIIRQGLGNPVGVNHHVRPSLSSEQLVSQSTSPQMLQQMTRF